MYLATRPGRDDKLNEDQVAAAGGTLTRAVLLDGAGGPAELPTGCHHGTPWYVAMLADAAMAHMRDPLIGLDLALSRAIATVAAEHRAHPCDLDHPGTPSSTVVMVRRQAGTVEYLVLGDSTVVADVDGEIVTVSDRRIDQVGTDLWKAMAALPTGTTEHQAARIRFVEHQRRMRNKPDGYPCAGTVPEAAHEALTGTLPATETRRVALLSDGATRFVEFGLGSWTGLLDILGSASPWRLFDQVREAEAQDPEGERWPRAKRHDDIAVIHLAGTEL
ncbi:protein phosphatase 2C domain-containing protein [Nonomuraea jiangxiensis]|uniref:Protein phosphatase 2C n=1 Tax=Nonomuraea jiangxiensis TaxID=633440 RepID=A0A1G9IT82_9ACTN|nr:protein phosphatase 2C domain-containing protein [Nonomuraea jiangxiensis]SDL28370.1 Protein phosphatase 2C [Nonomuraea jiangxiensis]